MEISEIMTTAVCTISSDKSVSYAAERMNECGKDALVVMDHGELMGIVTSREIRSTHPNRIVADAMNRQPKYIFSEHHIWEALSFLQACDDDLLLVMDGQELVGVVSREAVQLKIAEYLDPLTGLYRAPYIQCIGKKWLREGQPFHLLFIDVNDFGKINKVYGHPFGDDVIRWFSGILTDLADEKSDHLCRYAGDEFIMLTTGREERVRHCIDAIEKPTEIGQVNITAAVGHLDGFREPDFFARSLREHIAQASLLSTAAKMQKSSSLGTV